MITKEKCVECLADPGEHHVVPCDVGAQEMIDKLRADYEKLQEDQHVRLEEVVRQRYVALAENERAREVVEKLTTASKAAAKEMRIGADTIDQLRAENERLRSVVARMQEALEVIASCPPEALHLMPMAAEAGLSEGDATEAKP